MSGCPATMAIAAMTVSGSAVPGIIIPPGWWWRAMVITAMTGVLVGTIMIVMTTTAMIMTMAGILAMMVTGTMTAVMITMAIAIKPSRLIC